MFRPGRLREEGSGPGAAAPAPTENQSFLRRLDDAVRNAALRRDQGGPLHARLSKPAWPPRKRKSRPSSPNPEPPTFANTIEALERSGAAPDPGRQRLLQPDRGEHERRAAEDRGRVSPRSWPSTRTTSTSTPKLFARVKVYRRRQGPAHPDPRAGPAPREDLQESSSAAAPTWTRPRRPSSGRSTRSCRS